MSLGSLQPRTSYPVTERVTFPIDSEPSMFAEKPSMPKPYAFIKRPKGMYGDLWQQHVISKLGHIRKQRNAQGDRCALRRGRETRDGIEILRVR